MKLSRLLLLLVLPLFVAACGPTAQQQADDLALQRSGVSPATYDKMVHGDTLSLFDIENLSRAGVNQGIILRYIRDQGSIYTLNSADVIRLRRAGVSQSVIDYMLQSARNYYAYPGIYDPYDGPWWGPWYGPGFYGPAFGFGFGGGGRYGGGHYHHH
jgi:hypothetical protein